MKIALDELTAEQVEGLNKKAVLEAHRKDPLSQQKHVLRDPGGLRGCVDAIFTQLTGKPGYANAPIERMAALVLHRIAQGQFFVDGNKRTALLACVVFLGNNGHKLKIERARLNDLIWGFAAKDGKPAKYRVEDAEQYIYDNIYPIT